MLIFPQRRFYSASTIGLWLAGIILVACFAMGSATADIGASLEQTKARSSTHAAKHQGRYPLYETDGRGTVVRECWEAPTGGWTKPQAMSLVKDLVPQPLKNQTPRRLDGERGGEMFVYQDGTTVWLEYSSVNPLFKLVAVWISGFRGPKC